METEESHTVRISYLDLEIAAWQSSLQSKLISYIIGFKSVDK